VRRGPPRLSFSVEPLPSSTASFSVLRPPFLFFDVSSSGEIGSPSDFPSLKRPGCFFFFSPRSILEGTFFPLLSPPEREESFRPFDLRSRNLLIARMVLFLVSFFFLLFLFHVLKSVSFSLCSQLPFFPDPRQSIALVEPCFQTSSPYFSRDEDAFLFPFVRLCIRATLPALSACRRDRFADALTRFLSPFPWISGEIPPFRWSSFLASPGHHELVARFLLRLCLSLYGRERPEELISPFFHPFFFIPEWTKAVVRFFSSHPDELQPSR